MATRTNLVATTVLVVLVLIMSDRDHCVVRAQSAAQCKKERRILVNACKPVLERRPPSGYCCQRIRVTHASCVCSVVTPQLAALVDVNYAIRVVRSCGRRVPRRFKCGSIRTP